MITIRTPEIYINEPDILKSAGEYIVKLGKSALIVGGITALSVAGEELSSSLKASGVKFEVNEFKGYCTLDNIEKYTSLVKELNVDILIGVGGGRVLDLVKVVGERSNVNVVTVPTIAATCAAWSALTVVYDEFGRHTEYIRLNTSPKLVLVDTKIISAAPVRFLNAGIGDTIVKWYESAPHAHDGINDISLRIGIETSKLALEILNNSAAIVSQNGGNGKVTQELSEVVDSIIILAGIVGSINGGNHRGAVAHALHDSFTSIADTHESLHGEKVIFGLIVQFIMEGKSLKEIDDLIIFLNKLNLPVTLKQLGIIDNVSSKISEVANGVKIIEHALDKLNFEVNIKLLEQAIKKADELGENSLKA